jgi:predicted nucleotidyltransferase
MKTPAEKAEKKLDAIVGVYTLAEQIEIRLEKRLETELKVKGFVLKTTKNRLATISVRLLDLKFKLDSACSELLWLGDDSQREYAESIRIAFSEYK